MFVRWILLISLTVATINAIPRPETKATLRSLTRLPRVEMRFSLDCDSARGFAAFAAAKDPSLAAIEIREKLNGSRADARLYLEMAGLRMESGDLNAAR